MTKELVKTTYSDNDCIFLLKDLTDLITEISVEEKEKRIAAGENYSNMISKEYPVSDEINKIFKHTLENRAKELATLVASISEASLKKYGDNIVIVSLARAGSPIGCLMKRYYKYKYNKNVPHYSISIIRGKGIDENALNYIFDKHPDAKLAFVDGWTGKGSITHELTKAIKMYNEKTGRNVDDGLVVLADPAKKSAIYGTRHDICIPNACLNSTVSGLVSRTIHNEELISEDDFHGAKYFGNLASNDLSNYFLEVVSAEFENIPSVEIILDNPDLEYVDRILNMVKEKYNEDDPTRVKLSIGETSRALLRRKPRLMVVNNKDNPDLEFVLHLAEEKGVPVICEPIGNYECISILTAKSSH